MMVVLLLASMRGVGVGEMGVVGVTAETDVEGRDEWEDEWEEGGGVCQTRGCSHSHLELEVVNVNPMHDSDSSQSACSASTWAYGHLAPTMNSSVTNAHVTSSTCRVVWAVVGYSITLSSLPLALPPPTALPSTLPSDKRYFFRIRLCHSH